MGTVHPFTSAPRANRMAMAEALVTAARCLEAGDKHGGDPEARAACDRLALRYIGKFNNLLGGGAAR